jgi:hypothetical protein
VSWAPAGFIDGLAYESSPVIVISLTDAHLMVAMAPLPPLIVAYLVEILVRWVRRAAPAGLLLGGLVGLEFFVGTELLVITLITLGATVTLLSAVVLRRRGPIGLPVVVRTGRTSTPVRNRLGDQGADQLRGHPAFLLLPAPVIPIFGTLVRRCGGYQVPVLSGDYMGIRMILAVVIGLVL